MHVSIATYYAASLMRLAGETLAAVPASSASGLELLPILQSPTGKPEVNSTVIQLEMKRHTRHVTGLEYVLPGRQFVDMV